MTRWFSCLSLFSLIGGFLIHTTFIFETVECSSSFFGPLAVESQKRQQTSFSVAKNSKEVKNPSRGTRKQRNRTKFFNSLFKNYDKRLLPSNTTTVEAAIFLNSLDSISEQSFDYDLGIFLRLKWTDPRLKFNPKDIEGENSINIDALMYEQLWVPDLTVANEKKASFHTVTTPNRLIKLDRNGSIMYSSRLYLTLTCQMELHSFPFDTQFCDFQLNSYAYPQERIQLRWASTPLEVTPNLLIAQFSINSIDFESTFSETPRGNFSSLIVTFQFVRHVGFYVIQIYLPSLLTVLTAFTAFWIDPLAVPGRVTIGVFTTLIMANMSFSFRATLPTVSYIKAIDIWILACTLFVFTSLVEYAIANVLLRQKPKICNMKFAMGTFEPSISPQTPLTPVTPRQLDAPSTAEDNENIQRQLVDNSARRKSMAVPTARDRFAPPGEIKIEEMSAQVYALQRDRHRLGYHLLRLLAPHTEAEHFHELSGVERCNLLEAICRRLFPGSFLLFNVVYWVVYLYFLPHIPHQSEMGAFPMHGDRTRHVIEHQ